MGILGLGWDLDHERGFWDPRMGILGSGDGMSITGRGFWDPRMGILGSGDGISIRGWERWDPRTGILGSQSGICGEHAELRHSSIILFGNLSRVGRADSEVFSEQILNGLATLLLHLQDPQPDVVKVGFPGIPGGFPAIRGIPHPQPPAFPLFQACKFALRMCGPSLGCEELREMFGNHLREERGLHYGEFINDVCKFLVGHRWDVPGIASGYRD
ncbi:hypothetical protein DV515_00019804, partial [Chloebia gouldiae]